MQRRDEEDGRSRRVELTAAGRAKLAESNRLWRGAQDRFETVYGSERAAALRVALAEIYSDEFAQAFEQGTPLPAGVARRPPRRPLRSGAAAAPVDTLARQDPGCASLVVS